MNNSNGDKIQSNSDYEAFRGTTDILPCAVIIATPDADGDGYISFVNSYGLQMFGYSPEEMIGQSLEIIIPEAMREKHRKWFRLASSNGTVNNKVPRVLIGKRKDNSEIVIRLGIDCWKDERGLRFVAAAIEIK